VNVVIAVAVAVAPAAAVIACGDNLLMGNVRPVPPAHRVPPDIEGRVILIAEDAEIQTRDPVHIQRARKLRVPQDLRAAMVDALTLAGFKVVAKPEDPHDLVAKVALAVSEPGGKVRQVYRCGLTGKDGANVAQIDWVWPEGTYVDTAEVYAYASHHVATEIATSRAVLSYLRGPTAPLMRSAHEPPPLPPPSAGSAFALGASAVDSGGPSASAPASASPDAGR